MSGHDRSGDIGPGPGPDWGPDPVLARLMRLHPKVIDLSLERLERLLAALGHPERHLPPVVHVAGTNGKGSVVAFTRAGLEAAGHRVHVYTSPHLVRFGERIRLAGTLITDDALTALLEEVEAANDGQPVTFFEVTTAAAFLAFSRMPADVLLLEVGLGGRLDATNVIDDPAVSVITPVDLDHAQFLGTDLAGVAAEKAGILKAGAPAVVAAQRPEAAAAIAARAATLGVRVAWGGNQWSHGETEDGAGTWWFRRADAAPAEPYPAPRLIGPHQIANAAQAFAVLDALEARTGLAVSVAARRAALSRVDWPARLQWLAPGEPLPSRLPPGWSLWLDGGHNPHAGRALAAALVRRTEGGPLDLIAGMLDTKDPGGFLAALRPLARRLVCVPVPESDAGLPPETLAAVAGSEGYDSVFQAPDVSTALDLLAGMASGSEEPATVLICGSLYLAGDVLRKNGTPPV